MFPAFNFFLYSASWKFHQLNKKLKYESGLEAISKVLN